MARKKGGCGVLFLILVGAGVWKLAQEYPEWLWVGWGLLAVCVLAVVFGGGKGRCDVCNNPIKRQVYKWRGPDGKKRRICPACARVAERHESKAAMNRLLSKE